MEDKNCQTKYYNIQKKEVLEIEIDISNYSSIQKDTSLSQETKHYLIVIDRSGSMSGSYLKNTLEVTKLLTDHILESYPQNSRISLICFDHQIEIHSHIENHDTTKRHQIIESIVARGGTNFGIAQNAISDYINSNKCENLSLVFLTDGQGTQSVDCYKNLQKAISDYIKNLEVHTVGIGSSHDPKILDDLICLKTSRGTYQFIKEINDIYICFEAIKETMEEKFLQIQLFSDQIHKTDMSMELEAQKVGENQLKSLVSVEEIIDKLELLPAPDNQPNYLLKLHDKYKFQIKILENLKTLCKIPLQITNVISLDPETDKYKLFQLKISLLDKGVTELINNLKSEINNPNFSFSQSKLNEISQKIGEFSNTASQLSTQIFKLKLKSKDQLQNNNNIDNSNNYLFQKIGPLMNRIEGAEKILELITQKKSQTMSTNLIAEVNALSYSEVQNKLFKKRLEKRKEGSSELFNSYHTQMQKMASDLQNDPKLQQNIEKDHEDQLDQLQCFLSCQNFLECNMDSDCLCISFSVQRSELSIVRPESLKIVNVYPTVISAKSFISAVQHAIKISPEKSGGFQKKEGEIIKGVASEYINAAFPIFLNENHWKFAKLWLEPILGWVTCLDALGYHHTQKRNVPFLILDKILQMRLENPDSEFLLQIYEQVKETCKHILQENEESQQNQLKIENSEQKLTIKEEFMDQLKKLVEIGVSQINQDYISNINIFLNKLLLAIELKWVDFSTFQNSEKILDLTVKTILEEKIRRNLKVDWQISQVKKLLSRDNVSFRTAFKEYEGIYSQSSVKVCLFQMEIIKNQLNPENLTENLKKFLKYFDKMRENPLEILQLKNQDQFLTLFIQNALHKDQRARKRAIGLKEYRYPWNLEELYLKELEVTIREDEEKFIQHQENLKKKSKHNYKTQGSIMFASTPIPSHIKILASDLIYSNNPKNFEMIVENMSKKKTNLRWYFWILVTRNAVLLEEKIRVITDKFGRIKLKNYHKYILDKGSILSSNFLDEISKE